MMRLGTRTLFVCISGLLAAACSTAPVSAPKETELPGAAERGANYRVVNLNAYQVNPTGSEASVSIKAPPLDAYKKNEKNTAAVSSSGAKPTAVKTKTAPVPVQKYTRAPAGAGEEKINSSLNKDDWGSLNKSGKTAAAKKTPDTLTASAKPASGQPNVLVRAADFPDQEAEATDTVASEDDTVDAAETGDTLVDETESDENADSGVEIVQTITEDTHDNPNRIHPYMNAKIERYLEVYTVKKRDLFEKGVERSAEYLTMMRRIFREEGLPEELVYLSAVESNFNPRAISRAKATGIWQFMSQTGRLYQLQQSWWHDERYDEEKSTRAAARYLKALYSKFKKWELALAAYNSGPGRVRRAIRYNNVRGLSEDYWALKLPRETRGYVPAFMAVLHIFKNPDKYGFTVPQPLPEKEYDTVKVPGSISLKDVAVKTGVFV
ncbi:hypothetical protein CHS0354_018459 [Potamilus streckersoni]|uniref:Transglycosylase SLT domain-containing protein n=1 Tax=Potamilus streckersoni TaxID=2493646 RepID=A0AAE0TBM1_9BIVA|nr:hypothetical protein CHS0354_018459 [Potamilus streckersoni]